MTVGLWIGLHPGFLGGISVRRASWPSLNVGRGRHSGLSQASYEEASVHASPALEIARIRLNATEACSEGAPVLEVRTWVEIP